MIYFVASFIQKTNSNSNKWTTLDTLIFCSGKPINIKNHKIVMRSKTQKIDSYMCKL